MTKTILTTRFNFNIQVAEFNQITSLVAPKFSEIPGCCWKIWLINEDKREAGGIYLFESTTELEKFLKSDLFASVSNNPHFSNLQTDTFSVVEAASLITGATLMKKAV